MSGAGEGGALASAVAAASDERLERPFDAIVIGAGAAGGMASLLLAEAGLQVLTLDAGWSGTALRRLTAAAIRRVADPRLQSVLPAGAVAFGRKALRAVGKLRQPVQTRCFAWEMAPEAFVDDRDHPYVVEPGSRFDWFRVRQLGGRMTVPGHGRQYYRFAERDFHPADGQSPDWPLDPFELDPWYGAAEDRLGLAGACEDSPWIPDGHITHPLTPWAAEAEVMKAVAARWPGAAPAILGRSAPPLDAIGLAAATGRLTLRQGAVAASLIVEAGKVRGVDWVDQVTRSRRQARAPIVFLCASALESTRILLATRTADGRGLARASGVLGQGLMDHVVVSGEGGGGALPDDPVPAEPGRCVYLPRFDLRGGAGAGRGYGVQVYRWSLGRGRSYFNAVAFAEMTPRPANAVTLDPSRRDALGLPVLSIACTQSEAEKALARDQAQALRELGEALGVRFHRLDTEAAPPGTAIHECGTARMGRAPESSVLDPFNQCWDAGGLYVTDASAFPSQGAQNPTLTLLALTARACAQVTGAGAAPSSQNHSRARKRENVRCTAETGSPDPR